jgi:hypothetical protein
MNDKHPITPPPELVQQWINEEDGLTAGHIATQAALRAVVLKCEYSDDYGTSFINPDDILAIATDLEAQ